MPTKIYAKTVNELKDILKAAAPDRPTGMDIDTMLRIRNTLKTMDPIELGVTRTELKRFIDLAELRLLELLR